MAIAKPPIPPPPLYDSIDRVFQRHNLKRCKKSCDIYHLDRLWNSPIMYDHYGKLREDWNVSQIRNFPLELEEYEEPAGRLPAANAIRLIRILRTARGLSKRYSNFFDVELIPPYAEDDVKVWSWSNDEAEKIGELCISRLKELCNWKDISDSPSDTELKEIEIEALRMWKIKRVDWIYYIALELLTLVEESAKEANMQLSNYKKYVIVFDCFSELNMPFSKAHKRDGNISSKEKYDVIKSLLKKRQSSKYKV